LIKSFFDADVDLFTPEKLAKSSRGILRLYLPAFMVSSGSLGWLFKQLFTRGKRVG
jgi:hypothetical protein